VIGTSDTVRCQECDNFVRGEPSSIMEACYDSRDVLSGLGNQTVRSWSLSIRPSRKEGQTRSARALGNCNGSCELDKIAGGDVVSVEEGCEVTNRGGDSYNYARCLVVLLLSEKVRYYLH